MMTDVSRESEATTEQAEVIVKLQLSGGYQYTLVLKSDAPLLRNLLGTILSRVQGTESRTLFQIPMEAGRVALCFSSENLVSVITEPPVYVRPSDDQPELQKTPA